MRERPKGQVARGHKQQVYTVDCAICGADITPSEGVEWKGDDDSWTYICPKHVEEWERAVDEAPGE